MKVSDSGEMASTALFLAFASSLFNCGIQVDWSGLSCEARFWEWKLGPANAHYR